MVTERYNHVKKKKKKGVNIKKYIYARIKLIVTSWKAKNSYCQVKSSCVCSWLNMSSGGIIILVLCWHYQEQTQSSSQAVLAACLLTPSCFQPCQHVDSNKLKRAVYDGWPGSAWCLSLLPFRWWLAAQQCVSAPQRLWSALRVLAWCQMDVGAVRCVRHSSTRTAAPWNPVTTTKGWSVTSATMWRWPGVFVEVGRWRGKTTYFCGQDSSIQQIHWLDLVTLHIWEGVF